LSRKHLAKQIKGLPEQDHRLLYVSKALFAAFKNQHNFTLRALFLREPARP